MKKIILASASPRRKELLSRLTEHFECVVSDAQEIKVEKSPTPWLVVMENAALKAKDVFENHKDCIVIGADTVVVYDGYILGKPKDKADAFDMLNKLQGKRHYVYTGLYIIKDGKEFKTFEKTAVNFGSMTAEEIQSYIDSGEPMDKAGAYGIQGKGSIYIKSVEGDYYNVMGLPLHSLKNALKYF